MDGMATEYDESNMLLCTLLRIELVEIPGWNYSGYLKSRKNCNFM